MLEVAGIVGGALYRQPALWLPPNRHAEPPPRGSALPPAGSPHPPAGRQFSLARCTNLNSEMTHVSIADALMSH
jgi:hypothetical protein